MPSSRLCRQTLRTTKAPPNPTTNYSSVAGVLYAHAGASSLGPRRWDPSCHPDGPQRSDVVCHSSFQRQEYMSSSRDDVVHVIWVLTRSRTATVDTVTVLESCSWVVGASHPAACSPAPTSNGRTIRYRLEYRCPVSCGAADRAIACTLYQCTWYS